MENLATKRDGLVEKKSDTSDRMTSDDAIQQYQLPKSNLANGIPNGSSNDDGNRNQACYEEEIETAGRKSSKG